MHTRLASLLALFAGFSLTLSSASATDVWVDTIGGDNANGGTGPGDAWRTITFALDQLGPTPGAGTDLVHVLPGIYAGPVNGGDETVPFVLRDGIRLVGEGPAELVILMARTEIGLNQDTTDWDTGLENMTLQGPKPLVQILSEGPIGSQRRATLTDLRIRQTDRGIRARWEGTSSVGSGLRIENCHFSQCGQALWASAHNGAQAAVDVTECVMSSEVIGQGFVRFNSANLGTLDVSIDRSRIVSSITQLYALEVGEGPAGDTRLQMTDSAVVSPCLATYGLRVFGKAHLERCTFAGHDIALQVGFGGPSTVVDCLFGDNYTDLDQSGQSILTITNCLIDNPLWSGSLGNTALQPVFVDRFNADYRLAYGSPGIDALPALGGLDLDGRPRSMDGDLDTQALRDFGAYESGSLGGPTAAGLGAPIELELAGDPGELARLFVSRVPLQSPVTTPFGQAWLLAGTRVALGDFVTTGRTPVPIATTAPSAPALVGATLGFQALQRDAGAPFDTAWSAPVFVVLE